MRTHYSSNERYSLFVADMYVATLRGTHLPLDSLPLLPPDVFSRKRNMTGVIERRKLWKDSLTGRSDNYRVAGSWTSQLDPTCAQVFDTQVPGCITVTHSDGMRTEIKWRMGLDVDYNRNLMEFVSKYDLPNCRYQSGEPGGMFAIGYQPKKQTQYQGAKGFRLLAETFGRETSNQVEKRFSKEYSAFRQADKIQWKGFPTKRIVVSKNLMNSIHIDKADTTVSLACFVACKNEGTHFSTLPDLEGWYLTFPHTTVDGKRCVALRLRNFCWICWDGRHQSHHTILEDYLTKNLNRERSGYYSLYMGGS